MSFFLPTGNSSVTTEMWHCGKILKSPQKNPCPIPTQQRRPDVPALVTHGLGVSHRTLLSVCVGVKRLRAVRTVRAHTCMSACSLSVCVCTVRGLGGGRGGLFCSGVPCYEHRGGVGGHAPVKAYGWHRAVAV